MTNILRTIPRLLVALFFTTMLHGQTNNPTQHGQTNDPTLHHGRYLFIVETSSAMRKTSENAMRTVRYLMTQRLTNELKSGDTVGLWTFDSKLHAGDFALQVWTPGNFQLVPRGMIDFLHQQPEGKEPSMDDMMPPLAKLIRTSEKITVIMISSGVAPIHGTPYDVSLNETYTRSRGDLKKKGIPFVTVLRGWHGKLIGASVAWQPWPVELPPFPPDPEPVEAAKPEAAAEPAAPRPSLIITGEKPAPVPAAPVAPPPTETNAPAPVEAPSPVPSEPAPVPAPVPVPPETVFPPTNLPPPVLAAPTPPSAKAVPAPPAPVPVPAPAESKAVSTPLIWVAVGLLLAAVVLVYLLVRRSRSTYRKSLITQSMERGQK